MLFEDKGGNISFRRLAVVFKNHAIDNRKPDVWIIARNTLHDRALRETDPDDQIEAALGKRAHRRFDRSRIAGLNFTQHDPEGGFVISLSVLTNLAVGLLPRFRALNPDPGGRIERTIVFAADVENNSNADIFWIFSCVARSLTSHATENQKRDNGERDECFQFHQSITSLTSWGGSTGASPIS